MAREILAFLMCWYISYGKPFEKNTFGNRWGPQPWKMFTRPDENAASPCAPSKANLFV